MRFFYATDIHGSDLCFRKFLHAAEFYKVDALLLGGDYTSKQLVFIVKEANSWHAQRNGQKIVLQSVKAVQQFRAECSDQGILTRVVSVEEWESMRRDEGLKSTAYKEELCSLLERWAVMATHELQESSTPILFIPGNDDPLYADQYFSSKPFVCVHEGRHYLDEDLILVGLGGSNPTPWNTFREHPEEEIKHKLESVWPKNDSSSVILFVHVPPWNSGLDIAPKLREDLSYDLSLGEVQLVPVGSTAVRWIIETRKPILGLFGHIHEAQRYSYIGSALCINPGSAYRRGVLRGCVISLQAGKVEGFQFTEG